MNELALFAGVGGGLLATKWLLGWKTICYVEWEQYCIDVLKARIKDGLLDDAPIWGDAQTFNGYPWTRCVDIITAGFPCQPFSNAGKRKGNKDKRNMWPSTIRIIREVKPGWVLLENVPGLLSSVDETAKVPVPYFGTILADLAQSGYDARWRMLSATEMGAPHKRDRMFIVAYSNKEFKSGLSKREETTYAGVGISSQDVAYTNQTRCTGHETKSPLDTTTTFPSKLKRTRWWETESQLGRVANGVADQVDRLKAIGNGQIPIVVATVWELLTEGL